jgi:ketosteroid isomerase-like protein
VLRDCESAWRARDAAALSELFTEDGFVLSNGRPPVRGRAAIRAAYAQSGGPLALRTLAYATEGRVGYIVGGFARSAGEPDTGKFVLALRKEGERWQIAADMDNGNQSRMMAPTPIPMPAPVSPPAPANRTAVNSLETAREGVRPRAPATLRRWGVYGLVSPAWTGGLRRPSARS